MQRACRGHAEGPTRATWAEKFWQLTTGRMCITSSLGCDVQCASISIAEQRIYLDMRHRWSSLSLTQSDAYSAFWLSSVTTGSQNTLRKRPNCRMDAKLWCWLIFCFPPPTFTSLQKTSMNLEQYAEKTATLDRSISMASMMGQLLFRRYDVAQIELAWK